MIVFEIAHTGWVDSEGNVVSVIGRDAKSYLPHYQSMMFGHEAIAEAWIERNLRAPGLDGILPTFTLVPVEDDGEEDSEIDARYAR